MLRTSATNVGLGLTILIIALGAVSIRVAVKSVRGMPLCAPERVSGALPADHGETCLSKPHQWLGPSNVRLGPPSMLLWKQIGASRRKKCKWAASSRWALSFTILGHRRGVLRGNTSHSRCSTIALLGFSHSPVVGPVSIPVLLVPHTQKLLGQDGRHTHLQGTNTQERGEQQMPLSPGDPTHTSIAARPSLCDSMTQYTFLHKLGVMRVLDHWSQDVHTAPTVWATSCQD
jgi:hypothetical protein